jgi:hypothetical protein
VTLAYVPALHATAALLPAVQKKPAGQIPPVLPSVGRARDAPPMQKYPGSQLPVGAVIPVLPQYIPALHAVQLAAATSPAVAEYVPLGHGVGLVLPAGQKLPAVQMPPAGWLALEPAEQK